MARRPTTLLAAAIVLVGAWPMALPAAAQDQSAAPQSTVPLGPPAATPIADPPLVPSGDGTGVRLTTELGDIVIGLFTESSPVAAENFLNLAKSGFYDGTVFHRLVPGFVIQGGDPTGTGMGDPGYSIVDEPVVGEYGRGIVAMARSQAPNSQGSQFFIVLDDDARSALEAARTYAIFGRVVEGMDVVDAIAAGPTSGDQALEPVAIESTTIEQVGLPPEPSPPPAAIDVELGRRAALVVDEQQLQPQTITGAGLEREFAADDPVKVGLREIAEAQGHTLEDVSIVVAGTNLSSGQLIDITGLRIKGADGARFLLPFAALITEDPGVTATPATLADHEVQIVTGSGEGSVPITGFVDGDVVLLIRTADEAARDEILGQLP